MTAQLPISKEQLLTDIAHAEEKAATLCGPCADDHARLAGYLRALLAAQEQEPVAWKATHLDSFAFGETKSAVEEHADRFGWELEFTEITPLYTRPAPVHAVPELSAVISELEKVHDWIMHTLPIPSPSTIPNAKRITGAINACRAAMLNGGKS